ESEDMWHTYNLVQSGDSLRASTFRKVQTESATGSVGSSRVRTVLTISVEAVDFDSQACLLRVKGKNIQENPYVKLGAYHTIELEINRKFTLAKKHWDSVVLERIDQACDPASSADLAAVVLQEGLAHVCLVTASMTIVRAKVETSIPRKRRGSCTQHDKALERFYDAVVQAAGEIKALEDFLKCLQHEPDKAFYGVKHVERAIETEAVDVLLVSDTLFRNQEVAVRNRYVRIVDSVKEGGELNQLGGIAAILRFPVPDADTSSSSNSDEDN
uniref:Protein pelota homolog n=1 Tax=Eptatretus burgeri TaxID=7764 RepID=A0A8C4NJ79_EPTBU